MKLQFGGVRGFVPTPGREYLRYGGNTCCTAVRGAGNELVVIDAGTGFCQLADTLLDGPLGQGRGEMVLLISHTHWDHILGLPFPAVVHLPGNRLTIYGPNSTRGSLEMVYDGLLSPAYSPVYGLAHIGATHTFHAVNAEPFAIGGLQVRAEPFVNDDPNSAIWAYRIEEGQHSLAYITDLRYADDQVMRRAVEFVRGVDVLIHSAPYLRREAVKDYGHCRVEDAIELALQAEVQTLFLFHHAPDRTDDQLDALLAEQRARLTELRATLQLEAAREGPVIDIG